MSEAAIELSPAGEEGACAVRGALTFATVTSVCGPGLEAIQNRPRVEFDLSQVSHIDSAGLALLLEWVRAARHRQIPIRFSNLPAQASRLARACRVDALLGGEDMAG